MKNFLNKTKSFFTHETLHLISIICIFVFALLPLLTLLFKINLDDLKFVFQDSNFYKSILNSFIYTISASLITTVLATITAYLLDKASLKHKNLVVSFLTLGMLVPTLSVGLGIRVLFGRNGFLDQLLGLNIEGVGFFGLILGSVISSFPACFLIIYDSLRYENKGPYDAAEIMGISKLSTFFRATLPYLKVSLLSAFFATFTLIFSDYGIPMELAGKIQTLPMYLYDQIMSTFQYGRGSIAGLILLIPSVLSFIFDLIFKENSDGEKQKQMIKASNKFNCWTIVFIALVVFVLFTPQLAFITLSFTKAFPNDLSFTFENLKKLFSDLYGVGIYQYALNSIIIALLTSIIGVAFAYLLGYLAVRKKGKTSKAVNLLAISTIAIPGIVLGIGYMTIFKGTYGFFYGTMAILIVVNVFHFLGSPYLLAKNSLSKINKDYEIVGETLGISNSKIFFKVLIPNSKKTIIEMFSYYFLNSMITISAVAFLCSFDNQPLSILITVFEKSGNYEMQAVISVLIFGINIVFKCLITFISNLMKKDYLKEDDRFMKLSRYQFELLTYLEKNGRGKYSQRYLSDILTLSLGTINKIIKEMTDLNYIEIDSEGQLALTEDGLKALEPYRVKKAIILAAGFGSRMAPVTLDTPKPLVTVNGVRIIDSLLDALVEKDIRNIYIVRGYKKEKFNELLDKYPFIQFIDNEDFNITNNISSAMKALDLIDGCYICEADLLIRNKDLIRKYEYATNYLGAKVKETDDWCFNRSSGYITQYRLGGEDCYQAYGISYWNHEDSEKLRDDIIKVWNSKGGKENFWDAVPLKVFKRDFKIEVKPCHKTDIVEIDNFSELVDIDSSYASYPHHEEY